MNRPWFIVGISSFIVGVALTASAQTDVGHLQRKIRSIDQTRAAAAMPRRNDFPSDWVVERARAFGYELWPRCKGPAPRLGGVIIRGDASTRYTRNGVGGYQRVVVTVTIMDSVRSSDAAYTEIAERFGAQCLPRSFGRVVTAGLGSLWDNRIHSIAFSAQNGGSSAIRPRHGDYYFIARGRVFVTFAFVGARSPVDSGLRNSLLSTVLMRLGF